MPNLLVLTFQLLSDSVKEKFERMQCLVLPVSNFAALRAFHDQPPDKYPSVKTPSESSFFFWPTYSPVLFVKDLTMINEGNPDWIDKRKGIINGAKMNLLGMSLFDVN